ncbi:MAG: M48 family metalloprotease [Deltaproteobacteria bacterium]|jgi:Zn-dependent protease with chaperone function|nr:M48 family metalloprotease [Deltaproteobacteria bacterium]
MPGLGPPNFFEKQRANRRRSALLLGLFLVAFFLWHWSLHSGFDFCLRLMVSPRDSSALWLYYSSSASVKSAIIPTLTVAIFSLTASRQALLALRNNGGSYVATALGGIPLGKTESVLGTPAGAAKEKILRHVVSEMSLAAGPPEPDIYISPYDDSVNALTSGFDQDDAAIVLTKGALRRLSRDELAGLIGHELSHILNGDTRLNSLLAGGLKRLFYLTEMGFTLSIRLGRLASLIPLGLIMMVVGAGGFVSRRLLQAAFNRQGELMADATATQFTRDPHCLARALIKIGGLGETRGPRSRKKLALEYQRLFLVKPNLGLWSRLFKTHPPLAERIWDLWPEWDGHWPDLTQESVDYLRECPAQETDDA